MLKSIKHTMTDNSEINNLFKLVDNSDNSKEDNLNQLQTCISGYNDLALADIEEISKVRNVLGEKVKLFAQIEIDNERLSNAFEEIKGAMGSSYDTLNELVDAANSFENSINEENYHDSKVINELNTNIASSRDELKSIEAEHLILQEKLKELNEGYTRRAKDHANIMTDDKQEKLKVAQMRTLQLSKELEAKTKINEKLNERLMDTKEYVSKKKKANNCLDSQLVTTTAELNAKKILLSEKKNLFAEKNIMLNSTIESLKLRISSQTHSKNNQSAEISSLDIAKTEIKNAAAILNKIPCEEMIQQHNVAAMKVNLNDCLIKCNEGKTLLNKFTQKCEAKRVTLKEIQNKAEFTDVSHNIEVANQKLIEIKALAAFKREQLEVEKKNFVLKRTEVENQKSAIENSFAELVNEHETFSITQNQELNAKKETCTKITAQYKKSKEEYQNLFAQCRILNSSVEDLKKQSEPKMKPGDAKIDDSEESSSQATYAGEPVQMFSSDIWIL